MAFWNRFGAARNQGIFVEPSPDYGDSVGAFNTIDSRRHYAHAGVGFGADFVDPTGIPSGVTYYFWGVNTSQTKNVYIDPVFFNQNTLAIYYCIGGSYTKNSVAYTPIESPSIALPVHNLDAGSSNTPSFILYYQGAGAYPFAANAGINWTWNAGTPPTPTGSWVVSEYGTPSNLMDIQYILRPGQKIMGSISNTGASKIPYSVKMIWYEAQP